ncbi:ubiquitin-protein ligase E3 A [Pancytospora philotis]|nr:ubiquitin-protein ligase E3 A [Pancytospora philotis]
MSKYRDQLTRECPNSNCLKIFCRRHHSAQTISEVAQALEAYKDAFHCENIEALLRSAKPIYANPIIDLYFYVDGLLYGARTSAPQPGPTFTLRRAKPGRGGSTKEHKRATRRRPGALPYQELEHAHCALLKGTLSPTDVFLLVGVLHLLLKKFQKAANMNNALIIVRLFAAVSRTSCLEPMYYALLLEVYDFLYKRFSGAVINYRLADACQCDAHAQCLFQLNLCGSDVLGSTEAVTNALNASLITDVRESQKVRCLLGILSILHDINEKTRLMSFDKFYLPNFCSRISLKSEFKFLRSAYETALRYHFIVPVQMKAEILKMTNREAMKSSLQDAFFRSLFEGVTEPYLVMAIRRDRVYEDTLALVQRLEADSLKKQLKIQFVGEDGVDSGGIRKEYFQLLSREIASDARVFVPKNNRVWFRPGADLGVLALIGRIMGMALYNDIVINVPLSFIGFKKLLALPLGFEDLQELEPEHFRSIANLQSCSDEELRASELFFTVQDGDSQPVELVPGGARTAVTRENLEQFEQAYARYYTELRISEEFSAFMGGFYLAVSEESIRGMRPHELEKIIIGVEEFDFKVIRDTAVYNGYTSDTRVIQDLWAIVDGYDAAYKKKLLQFITGNDRLPVGGSQSLRLTILRNGSDTERLPSSQTCFNVLLLPEYSSKEKLARKLSKALKLTAGFYLI